MDISAFIIGILLLLIAAIGLTFLARALYRRVAGSRSQARGIGLLAAAGTAGMVFLLTYLSAWVALRQEVIDRDNSKHFLERRRITVVREALVKFATDHGHYPDSIKGLAAQLPENEKPPHFESDLWEHPYQYTKTKDGFELRSLGRDGKPGGEGLDVDIDSATAAQFTPLEPTLSQFLFDAGGSRVLFNVAVWASLCAGLACFLTTGLAPERRLSMTQLFVSIVWTTGVTLVVAFFLVMIHAVGEHH
ncbi:MAG: type II secretion system protein GspG [Planctomycetia bacterium]|nr:type II secretion system protein GspG [Planctomycetia bacterium]